MADYPRAYAFFENEITLPHTQIKKLNIVKNEFEIMKIGGAAHLTVQLVVRLQRWGNSPL